MLGCGEVGNNGTFVVVLEAGSILTATDTIFWTAYGIGLSLASSLCVGSGSPSFGS